MIQEPVSATKEIYGEDDYNDMLDNVYGDVDVAGISYSTSYVLKELDPIAYRCGFSDFQEEKDVWVCPMCDEEYDDYDDAKWCCQEMPTCLICGEKYETEFEAKICCELEEKN